MDDTLKYLLGGLGVLGLAILAIPPAESEKEKAIAPVAAIQPQPDPAIMPEADPSYEDQPDENMAEEANGDQDEYESFGQPMNDARPLGAGNNEAANTMVANQNDGAPQQAMITTGNTNQPVESVQGLPAN